MIGGGEEDEGEEVVQEVGRGRKKGRQGTKHKRHDNNDNDSTQKISKRKYTPKKRDSRDIQKDTSLEVFPGPSHDLTPDAEITKARSKDGKKGKKSGTKGILEPVCKTSSAGVRYYSCPCDPCKETTVSIEGMSPTSRGYMPISPVDVHTVCSP